MDTNGHEFLAEKNTENTKPIFMNVIVSRNELLATMIFASHDESRFPLNGVCIEQKPNSRPILIATDGRRLAVIETQATQEGMQEDDHSLIFHPEFLGAICKLSKAVGGKLFPWIALRNKRGSAQVQVDFIGGDCVLHSEKNGLIELPFPARRPVVPDSKSRTPISELGINPEYTADYRKVAKILECPDYQVRLNLMGENSAVEVKINGLHYFYGVVMPLKLEEKVDYQPEFLGITNSTAVKP